MGAVVFPRVVGVEVCPACRSVVWLCRLQRDGTVPIHPRPVLGGVYDVLPDGRVRGGVADPSVARYQHHWIVCPIERRRSNEKRLREALEREVAQAIEEGRRPRGTGQLALIPTEIRPAWRRVRDGWVDLTGGEFAAPARPWNGVVVVDLTGRREPARPN